MKKYLILLFTLFFAVCFFFGDSINAQTKNQTKNVEIVEKDPPVEVASVPTPPETVSEMLRLANLKKGDVLYDLGSGDGRIPLEAAKKYGARAIGIEIKPQLVAEANRRAKIEGISHLAKFIKADLFKTSYKDADVVTIYLSDELNLELLPRLLRDLRPGAKIISHDFMMGNWEPDISVKVPWKNLYRNIHVWTVPKDKDIKKLLRPNRNNSNEISLELDKNIVLLDCPQGSKSSKDCNDELLIKVKTVAKFKDPKMDYQYAVSGGKIEKKADELIWNQFPNVPGNYKISVTATDSKGIRYRTYRWISITHCNDCIIDHYCPEISVSPYFKIVKEGDKVDFVANVSGGSQTNISYKWTLSEGKITAGQNTSAIKVDTTDLGGKTVAVTVEIGGLREECMKTASVTIKIEDR